MKVHLGFDFYGAGNIGDDLMLAGFLHLLKSQSTHVHLSCAIPHNISSQRHRFPEVDWHGSTSCTEKALVEHCDLWLGVGDTPFQTTDGFWLLDHILRQIELCRRYSKPMAMFGVGIEQEALREHGRITEILDAMDFVVTRDETSQALLSQIADHLKNKLFVGGDLANVVLRHIFLNDIGLVSNLDFDLGITVNGRGLSENDLNEVRGFLLSESFRGKRIAFIANEVRPGDNFERGIYSRVIRPKWRICHSSPVPVFRRLVPQLNNLLSRVSDGIAGESVCLCVPDYFGGGISDLVKHYNRYRVVISSRYHGVLAAAWAGCRVGAIAGRSKVKFLARDLDIPCVSGPLTAENLHDLYNCCKPASRESLALAYDSCVDAFSQFFGG